MEFWGSLLVPQVTLNFTAIVIDKGGISNSDAIFILHHCWFTLQTRIPFVYTRIVDGHLGILVSFG